MGVDYSDALMRYIDLVCFIYEHLFMNREERRSHRRELYRLQRDRENFNLMTICTKSSPAAFKYFKPTLNLAT